MSRRADVPENVSLVDQFAGLRVFRVAGEVAVEEEVFASRVPLIDRLAAPLLARDPHDLPVGRGEYRRASWGPDIDGQVLGIPSTLGEKRVPQPFHIDSLDRDQEVLGEQQVQIHVLGAYPGV